MAEIYSTYDGTFQGSTNIVESEERKFKVTYQGDKGANFSLIFRQKPNPIGFMKKLNGTSKGMPR